MTKRAPPRVPFSLRGSLSAGLAVEHEEELARGADLEGCGREGLVAPLPVAHLAEGLEGEGELAPRPGDAPVPEAPGSLGHDLERVEGLPRGDEDPEAPRADAHAPVLHRGGPRQVRLRVAADTHGVLEERRGAGRGPPLEEEREAKRKGKGPPECPGDAPSAAAPQKGPSEPEGEERDEPDRDGEADPLARLGVVPRPEEEVRDVEVDVGEGALVEEHGGIDRGGPVAPEREAPEGREAGERETDEEDPAPQRRCEDEGDPHEEKGDHRDDVPPEIRDGPAPVVRCRDGRVVDEVGNGDEGELSPEDPGEGEGIDRDHGKDAVAEVEEEAEETLPDPGRVHSSGAPGEEERVG